MAKQYTYLLLIVLTILGPLALSFDKKVAFYKSFFTFLKSIILTSGIYVIWDILFTQHNIWKFNAEFLLNPRIYGLPIEEYLYFIVVPYASLFIYECIKIYFPKFNIGGKILWTSIAFFSISMSTVFYNKWYTLVTFGLLAVILIYFILSKNKLFQQIENHLLLAWIICLIPMSYVNGVLTSKPVLIYNNLENCGTRIGTIPVEDFFYHMLYMVIMVYYFEKVRSTQKITS